jgi:hypothetical protein
MRGEGLSHEFTGKNMVRSILKGFLSFITTKREAYRENKAEIASSFS